MLTRIAYITYFAGVGASGLYGTYLSVIDFENEKKNERETNPDFVKIQLYEFIRYSSRFGIGFMVGALSGLMWPVVIVGKLLA